MAAPIGRIAKSSGKSNVAHMSLLDTGNNGTLILYVPTRDEQFYVEKKIVANDATSSRENSSFGTLTALTKGNADSSFLPIRDASKDSRLSNGKSINASKEVTYIKQPGVKDENLTNKDYIPLFMQFTDYAMPEIFVFGKKAEGKTTEIPGGKKLTQITGVFTKQMQFDVVLKDTFAQDAAAILEEFVGQKTVLFYTETSTTDKAIKGMDINQFTGGKEESQSYAWSGTTLDITFDYYHRHYIVAKITFEPLLDLVKNRIDPPAPNFVNTTKLNNDMATLLTGIGARGNKLASAPVNYWAKDAAAINNAIAIINKAKELDSLSSTWKEAEKFLKDTYGTWMKELVKFADFVANGMTAIDKFVNEFIGLTNLLLSPLNDLIKAFNILLGVGDQLVFQFIKIVSGLLDAIKNKVEAFKTSLNNINILKSKNVNIVQSLYTNLIGYFSNKKPYPALELTKLATKLNSSTNIIDPSIFNRAEYVSSLLKQTGKTDSESLKIVQYLEKLEKKKGKSDKDADAYFKKLKQKMANSGLITDTKKIREMESITKEDSDIDSAAKDVLQLNKILKAKETREKIIENLKSEYDKNPILELSLSDAIITALKIEYEKADPITRSFLNLPVDSIQIFNSNINLYQQAAVRTKILSSINGFLGDKVAEQENMLISHKLNTLAKQVPIDNGFIKYHLVTAEDLIRSYSGLALKYYQDALLGRKLEKWNKEVLLQIGQYVEIPIKNYLTMSIT